MYRLIIISLLILQSLIFSQRSQQDFQKELDAQSSAIQSLKDEIKSTQKRIQSENRKEKSSVRRVSNLSEEISLLQQLLKEIKKEEDKLLFIFEDGTYEVFTKNIKTEDTDIVIDYITNSKEET